MANLLECAWAETTGGVICNRCNRTAPRAVRRRCRLPGEADPETPLAKMAWSYSTAVAKWAAAGSPVRSQEEIERIFAICQVCEHFSNDKRPHCKLCGCSLSKAPDGLKNKIAMKTEICADRPPKWE